MKTVQDKNGNILEVEDSTPCHPGKNGALPIMLDEVEDADILQEMAEREAAYQAGAFQRAKDKKLNELKEYYKSDIVRKVTHNNRLVYVRKKSIDASTYLRGRVRDNVEVTECEWFYDDGGASAVLDLDGITAVNKLVVDKEQVIFKMKKYHQAAINSLTTESEVNSYDITADINGLSWI